MKKITLVLALVFTISITAFANTPDKIILATGTVVDNDNNPVVGASISTADGINLGVTTIDGTFSVQAPASSKLYIQYIGLSKQSRKCSTDMGTIKLFPVDSKNGIFLEVGAVHASKIGCFAAAGLDYDVLNLEVFYYLPSETYGAKLGFNIDLSTRFRITPQLGIRYCPIENTMYHLTGAKLTYIIAHNFGISFAPSYSLNINKTTKESNPSSVVDKFNNGADLRLSISYKFSL